MEAVFGLLLLLIRVSDGVETSCDGRPNGAQCSGALGGTLFLRLMDNASEIPRYQWEKETIVILKWSNNRITSNTLENRSFFISSNGTFRISNLMKSDSGEYKLIIFNSNGVQTRSQTLHLSVEGQYSLRVGLFAVLILFFICLIVICASKKNNVINNEREDDPELTYADVKLVPQQARRPLKQKVEEEVEYGQIKLT